MNGAFSEHVHQPCVRPIHIFVLSNVIRRPIVVVTQHSSHVTDDVDSVCGIYLPVLHAPSLCCRSPLVVLYGSYQFVPLVPRAEPVHGSDGLHTELGVPLWRADADEPLVVRCLLDTESAERSIATYLRVVDLPYTSATSTGLFPVAKYDVIAPDINFLDEFLTPAVASEPTSLTVNERVYCVVARFKAGHMVVMMVIFNSHRALAQTISAFL